VSLEEETITAKIQQFGCLHSDLGRRASFKTLASGNVAGATTGVWRGSNGSYIVWMRSPVAAVDGSTE